MKKGLLVDIVPDILPQLGGAVDRLRSATGALSTISAVLGQQVPGNGHRARKGRHEAATGKATKKAEACPLCAEQGRGKVINTYQRRFAMWPTPDHIDWLSYMITSCPAFTIMKPEEREDAVLRLGACTRCGAYIHSQVGCKRTPPECSEPTPGTCGRRHLTALHGGSAAVQGVGSAAGKPLSGRHRLGPVTPYLHPHPIAPGSRKGLSSGRE